MNKSLKFDLKSYLSGKRDRIDLELMRILHESGSDSRSGDRLSEAMRYSLMAGGKRLRPILCVAASEAVGGHPEAPIPAACALEMIHTYSLIHDDLPAMDDDDQRRGQPTCHVAFDEATAILAGDALLTLAFEILSAEHPSAGSPSKRLDVIRIISSAAGYHGMVRGQMLDMLSEGKRLALDELKRLHSQKTGALIEASVWAGSLLGGGTPPQIERLKTYAASIGLAFQVRDDILNIEGDPAVMGKAAGTDLNRNKNTYPALIGIEESRAFAAKLVNNALRALNEFDRNAGPLRAIAEYIIERNK
jgi:geranylgeranyl diphosphate synthase type II